MVRQSGGGYVDPNISGCGAPSADARVVLLQGTLCIELGGMKTAARFLLLAVLATADVAASSSSRSAAGRALAPSRQQPLAPAELGGDATQAAVAVTGGQAVEGVSLSVPPKNKSCARIAYLCARQRQ